MINFIAVVATLSLLVNVADLWLDLRHTRPIRKRRQLTDLAFVYVAAAEQRGGPGPDKKRWAIERLMEAGAKNTQAEALVEFAVRQASAK